MPVYVINGQRIFFSHIPKTAGSSLHALLSNAASEISGHDENWTKYWRRNGGYRDTQRRCSPQHMTWSEARERVEAPLPEIRFSVCRHPVSRLQSEYQYQMQRSRGRSRVARLGFSRWLKISLAAHQHDPHFMDNHFQKQTDFFDSSFMIFPLERGIVPIITWLEMMTGYKFQQDIPHLKSARNRPVQISSSDISVIEYYYRDDYRELHYPLTRSNTTMNSREGILTKAAGRVLAKLYASGNL